MHGNLRAAGHRLLIYVQYFAFIIARPAIGARVRGQEKLSPGQACHLFVEPPRLADTLFHLGWIDPETASGIKGSVDEPIHVNDGNEKDAGSSVKPHTFSKSRGPLHCEGAVPCCNMK